MFKGLRDPKIAVFIALIVVLSVLLVNLPAHSNDSNPISQVARTTDYSLKQVSSLGGTTQFNSSLYNGNIGVDVIFNFSNQASLNSLLNNLSNPASSQFQHYLTAAQFNSRFAPSVSTYDSSVSYFKSYGLNVKETFANRLLLSLSGSAANFSKAFHTDIMGYNSGSTQFFAPDSSPLLPAWLSSSVSTVIGLNSQYADNALSLNLAGVHQFGNSVSTSNGSAVTSNVHSNVGVQVKNGIQYFFGSVFQNAYNETPLLGKVLPTHAVIATLLWGGSYKTGGKTVYTGGFNPSDISYYFNYTLPSNEQPHVYGVPIGNALPPGTSANNDTSGAVVENTLDLEMAGSLAPGASIYNVYGQNSTLLDVTAAFEEILSPHSPYLGLLNVSVISNSWGSNDTIITQWNQLLKEAQARGISVLASSGDSGNDYNSAKSVSNSEYVQFPSTVAFNSYGVTAVGGTNISLDLNKGTSGYLSISSQQAWYEPGPQFSSATLGTVGGISKLYTEPAWQLDSQANSVIKGGGRGVPDIAAVANNTIIYFSNTTKANFYSVAGTSISSPVSAGIIAEINAYRASHNLGNLGFLDPNIYFLGTQQYNGTHNTAYLSPYFDVTIGHNQVYSALPGYDLVTGMGSINAYNFATDLMQKTYNLSFKETGLSKDTSWYVQVNGVEYGSSTQYLNVSLINGTYFFQVLNSGSLVSVPTGGHETISGSVVIRNLTFVQGYKVNFVENELPIGTSWYITSWNYTQTTFSNQISLLFPSGNYTFTVKSGDPNFYGSSDAFTVKVSSTTQTVNVNFTRGTFNVTFVETGLPAQGYQWSVTTGNITNATTGTSLNFSLPGGDYTFNIHPSGRYVGNYTSLTINTEGMNRTFYIHFGYGYYVTFNMSGLSSGYSWNLLIASYNNSSTSNTITVMLQNGTYPYYAYYTTTQNGGQTTVSFHGNVTVNGANRTIDLATSYHPFDLSYYAFYGALFIVGLAVLGIGLMMLRKK